MIDAIRQMLSSKKALAMVVGVVVAAAARLGWNVDTETIGTLLSPILVYLVGQGIADHGKESAKIHRLPMETTDAPEKQWDLARQVDEKEG